MKLNNKKYQFKKIKNYLKRNKLFFFFNGVSKNSNDYIKIKQNLKLLKLNVFKSFNKIEQKKLQNSIFKNMKHLNKSLTFFIKFTMQTKKTKNILLTKLYLLLFLLVAVKINNKIYPTIVFKKNINAIHYVLNNFFFFQFNLTHLKFNKKLF